MGFTNDLVVKLLHEDGQGSWEVMLDLKYITNSGKLLTVPAGFVTDFASVPRLPFIYAMYGNRAHKAAVLHDWLTCYEVAPRREADDLFLEAMLSTNVPEDIANAMHLAVRSYSASLEPKGPEGEGHNFI